MSDRIVLTCHICDPPAATIVERRTARAEWARHYAREHDNTTTPAQMNRLRRAQTVRPLNDPPR